MKDATATTVLAFCLIDVADVSNDIMVDETPITLLQNEVAVEFARTQFELGMDKKSMLITLQKLEKYRKIEILQKEDAFYKVKIRGIDFPINSAREKPEENTRIIPIEFDEWKRRDIKFVGREWSKKYLDVTKTVLNDFSEVAGEKMLHELTRSDYDAYMIHLGKRTKPLSETSLNNYTRVLKTSLSRAVELRHIAENPFARIKGKKVQRKKPLVMSTDEINYIMDFIGNPILKKAVYLTAMCGLRRGETTFLKWSDIDYEDEKLWIRNSKEHKTKFGKERYVSLTPRLIEVLTDLKKYCEDKNIISVYVFPNEHGNHFSESYMLTMLKRAVKDAGADAKIGFHTLRRSFATMMKTEGEALNNIRDILGHTSERTTQTYIGAHEDDLMAAMCRLHGSKFANG